MIKQVHSLTVLIFLLGFGGVIPTLGFAETVSVTKKESASKGFNSFGQAVNEGEKLWNDVNMGTTGFTCLSAGCHANNENMKFDANKTFPHWVEITGKVVTLSQMINYCLENPMKGKALPLDSDKMTAMAAFYRAYRIQYRRSK